MNSHRLIVLIKKEIGSYFNSPIGFVAIALFGVFACFLYAKTAFLVEDGSMRQFFETLIWLFLVLVPALGMGAIAQEKRSNTIEVLYSLPILKSEIIVAKFFALFFMYLLALGTTFIIPLSLLFISSPHIPTILVSYLGLLLMGGMMSSIVILFSSSTSSSIVAFLLSLLSIFCVLVLGSDFFSSILPSTVRSVLFFISPMGQLAPFLRGIVDFRPIIFFVSIIILFLMIASKLASKQK